MTIATLPSDLAGDGTRDLMTAVIGVLPRLLPVLNVGDQLFNLQRLFFSLLSFGTILPEQQGKRCALRVLTPCAGP